jgi:serine/threonine protein kinase
VLNGRGSKVAVKQIFKRQLRQMINAGREMSEDPLKEVAIMLSLRSGEIQHRNVMNLLEVGEDANSIYIVLPFANGGELFDTIDQGGAQDEGVTAFYIRKMASGLSHIHQSGVSMNDTSLENTLLHTFDGEEDAEPILMDFGMSNFLRTDDRGGRMKNIVNNAGKQTYLSPEVFARGNYDGVYADLWSLGIIAIMLATGCPPVDQPNMACGRFRYIRDGRVSELLNIWHEQHNIPRLTPYFHDFVKRLLIADRPWQRLPLAIVLEHPFVTGQVNLAENTWEMYKFTINVFQKLLHFSYCINNDINLTEQEQQHMVNIVNQFRVSVRNYSNSNGDIDNLIHWCNENLTCFFHDDMQLVV